MAGEKQSVSTPETQRQAAFDRLKALYDRLPAWHSNNPVFGIKDKPEEGQKQTVLGDGTSITMKHTKGSKDHNNGIVEPDRLFTNVTHGAEAITFTVNPKDGLYTLYAPSPLQGIVVDGLVIPVAQESIHLRQDSVRTSDTAKTAMRNLAEPFVQWVEQMIDSGSYSVPPYSPALRK